MYVGMYVEPGRVDPEKMFLDTDLEIKKAMEVETLTWIWFRC